MYTLVVPITIYLEFVFSGLRKGHRFLAVAWVVTEYMKFILIKNVVYNRFNDTVHLYSLSLVKSVVKVSIILVASKLVKTIFIVIFLVFIFIFVLIAKHLLDGLPYKLAEFSDNVFIKLNFRVLFLITKFFLIIKFAFFRFLFKLVTFLVKFFIVPKVVLIVKVKVLIIAEFVILFIKVKLIVIKVLIIAKFVLFIEVKFVIVKVFVAKFVLVTKFWLFHITNFFTLSAKFRPFITTKFLWRYGVKFLSINWFITELKVFFTFLRHKTSTTLSHSATLFH